MNTDDQVLGLTFDDGPDPQTTPLVLEALAEYRARATFFVLAERARRHPEIVARILRDGHEVGLHGVDHVRLSTVSTRQALAAIRTGQSLLEQLTGTPVRLFRPAYGALTLPQLLGSRALGMDVVVWSAWARDWEGADVDEVARRALHAVHPGAFLLLHDANGEGELGHRGAPQELDRGAVVRKVLAGLGRAGYRTYPVGLLLGGYQHVRTVWFERRRTALRGTGG